MDKPDKIIVHGARVHNLKNIDVEVPLNRIYNHANESRQESKRKASFLFKTKSDKYSTLTHTLKAFKSCLNTD